MYSSDEYFLKRRSWSNSKPPTPVQNKKRVSMPATLVRAYLAQFHDFIPPPGFPPIILREKDDEIDSLPVLCCSASCSRKAQGIIAKATPQELERIVTVLAPCLHTLMVDVYGNYACQTLFTSCSPAQRLRVVQVLAPHLLAIAKDSRGTHSLQALVSLTTLPAEEVLLVSAFHMHVTKVAQHPAAAHVLVKLVTTCRANSALIQPLIPDIEALCTNSLGLLVVKAAISCSAGLDREQLCSRLVRSCLQLMQDPFGNYAIQHMLETWGWEACEGVLEQVSGRLAQLSSQKFASNTVERLLEKASEQARRQLLAELLEPLKLRELLSNKFAQFVFKKALLLGGSEFRLQLQKAVCEVMPSIQGKQKSKCQAVLSLLAN